MKPLFHLSAAALNSYVLWYDQMYVDLPFPTKEMGELPMKARSVFLTMWCLLLQTVYHFIAFLCDVSESPGKRSALHSIRDAMFAVAFPLAIYVAATFWSIYLVDRDLIFPESLDAVYPPFFNHVMHTTVAVFILVELCITRREYPARAVGFSLFMSVFVAYLVWTFYIYFTCNAWVYPVFDRFTWPQRVVFILLSFVTGAGFYVAGEKVNGFAYPEKKVANGKAKNS